MRKGSSSVLRGLSLLSLVLLMALAFAPGAAFGAEPTSGYGTTTSTTPTSGYTNTSPTPTTTSTTTPSKGVAPSKEEEKPTSTTPASETKPEKTSTTPTEKASTLPFTGFDLRWDIGFGLVLMAAGFSIVVMQRRQRRDSGS